jgi:hypothetical protein
MLYDTAHSSYDNVCARADHQIHLPLHFPRKPFIVIIEEGDQFGTHFRHS